jgi:predicted protein tyrosine phosphatase
VKKYTQNISKDAAEALTKLPKNTALISINNEHSVPWDLKVSGELVHRQTFSDIVTHREYITAAYNPINTDQAYEIAAFIERNKEKNFIVNCEAGISRSGAICLFIHKNYGHKLKERFWDVSHPNPFVFGKLQMAYELFVSPKSTTQIYPAPQLPDLNMFFN